MDNKFGKKTEKNLPIVAELREITFFSFQKKTSFEWNLSPIVLAFPECDFSCIVTTNLDVIPELDLDVNV